MNDSPKAYPYLSDAKPSAVFHLPDDSTFDPAVGAGLSIECEVVQESGGIGITVGDTLFGDGTPVFIEWRNSELCIHVWENDSESPTRTIRIPLDY